VTSCPAGDEGSATIIVFDYESAPDVNLWYADFGCQTLDNGTIGAFEPGNPAFYQKFKPLVDQLAPRAL
jgi:hypothetical protein